MTILTASELAEIRRRDDDYGQPLDALPLSARHVRALLRHIDALSSLSPSAPGVEEREALLAGAEAIELFRGWNSRTGNAQHHSATLRSLASRLAAPVGDLRRWTPTCQYHETEGYPEAVMVSVPNGAYVLHSDLAPPSVAKGE